MNSPSVWRSRSLGDCLRILKIIAINIVLTLLAVLALDLILGQVGQGSEYINSRKLGWISKQLKHDFVIDNELGFRPAFAKFDRDEWGAIKNHYAFEKPPGKTRLLFIGDSVTDSGYLVDALKKIYREEKFEFWNGGVGSYNASQVVTYFEKYLHKLNPDHVIYTFHLNDFDYTPMLVKEGDEVVAYEPFFGPHRANMFLYVHSYLYRRYVNLRFSAGYNGSWEDRIAEVRKQLDKLRNLTEARGTKLTIIVNPMAADFNDWGTFEKNRYETALSILKDMGIRHFDPSPAIADAIQAKVPLEDQDKFHPSPELSAYLAQFLAKAQIFGADSRP